MCCAGRRGRSRATTLGPARLRILTRDPDHFVCEDGYGSFNDIQVRGLVSAPLPGQLDLFVDEVVPILQRRGIYKHDHPGQTFRDMLGLDVPVNRYTAARALRSAA